MAGEKITLKLDRSSGSAQRIVELDSGRNPEVFRGNAATFRIGIYDDAATPADLSGIASIALAYMPTDRESAVVAVDSGVSINDATFTDAQFQGGTHYHAEFSFSEADMNPTLDSGELERSYWLVCYGIRTSDGTEITFGGGSLRIIRDGTGNTVSSPSGGGTAITSSEAETLIEAQAVLYDEAQSLTAGEKTQARDNMEAISADETIQYLKDVTSLTGGTSADLDSVVTTDRTAGNDAVALFDADASDVFRVYELVAGTDAESTPDVVRPDDYAASTNEKVWKLRNSVAVTDHGGLNGLGDDDHTQYVLADGTRPITAYQELAGVNLTDATELTISAGAVTRTQGRHTVDTEADAASDDLATISGGSTGDRLTISPASGARTVVVKHGTGNIETWDGADITLDEARKTIELEYDGTNWQVLGPLSSAGISDHGGLNGLGDDDHTQYVLADGTRPITAYQELAGVNLTDATELTISAGAVAITQGWHTVDTEGDAASDDLDTISGGNTGDRLTISPASGARTVVVKHGTGNIETWDGADITLDHQRKKVELIYDGTNWNVIGVSGGISDHGSLTGLGDDDHPQYVLADGTRAITGTQEVAGLNLTDATTLTLSGSQITVTQGWHEVTVVGASFLKEILGGSAGDTLVLSIASGSDAVTLDHGFANILTWDGSDITLDDPRKHAQLIYDGTNWHVIGMAFVNPMSAADDLIIGGSGGAASRLAKGSTGQPLAVTSSGLGYAGKAIGYDSAVYTGGKQSLTGTYADINGSSISYNPEYSSGEIIYEFDFQIARDGSGGNSAFEFYVGGSKQTNYYWEYRTTNSDEDVLRIRARYTNSGTASLTFKIQGKNTTGGNQVHATSGGTSSAAVVSVTEIPT